MWSFARAMEACPSLFYLYDKTKDQALLKLAADLADHSLDWYTFFRDFPIKKPIWEYMPWQEYIDSMDEASQDEYQPTLLERDRSEELFQLYHTSHGVNIAMAFKYLAYLYKLTGDTKYLETLRNGKKTNSWSTMVKVVVCMVVMNISVDVSPVRELSSVRW